MNSKSGVELGEDILTQVTNTNTNIQTLCGEVKENGIKISALLETLVNKK
jgi:hypothetical protein